MEAWNEFREAGLLWWVNRGLHLFGWAIVVEVDAAGRVVQARPERTDCRGFSRERNEAGYERLSQYLATNARNTHDSVDWEE